MTIKMKMKFRAKATGSGHVIESRSLIRLDDTMIYFGLSADFDAYHKSLQNGDVGIVRIESDEESSPLFIQVDPDTVEIVPDDMTDYWAEVDGLGVEHAE